MQWIVPDIGLALTGVGMITVFRVSQTYVRLRTAREPCSPSIADAAQIMDACGPVRPSAVARLTSAGIRGLGPRGDFIAAQLRRVRRTHSRILTASFGLPLAGPSMFEHLGRGPGCSLLAGAMLLISAAMWPIYVYGPAWRARSRYTNHDGLK